MRWVHTCFAFALAAAGCGDNKVTVDEPPAKAVGATSSVGGSQVAHSKSFMLVTSIATGHAQVATSNSFINKPGVGGQK